MKTFQSLSLLLAVSLGLTLAHPDYSDSWEEFKQKFQKEYDSEEEEVGGECNIFLILDGALFRVTVSQSGPPQSR